MFKSGFFCKGPMLPEFLQTRKQAIIRKIQSITSLEELTDAFLEKIVKESVLRPLVLKANNLTQTIRTEDIPGRTMPFDFCIAGEERDRTYQKSVARISIGFDGDPELLDYCPSAQIMHLPQGDVVGNTIEWPVIFWGRTNDADEVKKNISDNIKVLELYFDNSNKDIAAFNKSLANDIGLAFKKKLEQLGQQIAILESMGIKQKSAEPSSPPSEVLAKAKKRSEQIILNVENLYLQFGDYTTVGAIGEKSIG